MNDNNRPAEVYDDPAFATLKCRKDFAFLRQLLKIRAAASVGYYADPTQSKEANRAYSEYRSLANWLWFVNFETAWRKQEVEDKRKNIEAVT
jgi:hypothetical protein